MKPIVGVIPLWDDEKDSIWMLPGYMEGISEAGGTPIIFPLTDDEEQIKQLMSMVDGVLLTGGQDVSPGMYGESPAFDNVECCSARDRMESAVLKLAIEQDKAVLGICRGIQFVNVALGGSLYQDIPAQHPSDENHHQNAPYNLPSHEVKITKDSPLHDVLGKDTIGVNSCHHQAVKELAPSLHPMAVSNDGLVEAVYMPGKKFFWAVQWHPEFSYRDDGDERKIFEAFVGSMTD